MIQSPALSKDKGSIRSSHRRALPALPRVESLPSISSMESFGRYDATTGKITGRATGTATGRRYETMLSAGVRSGGIAAPRHPSVVGTATSFLNAPTASIPGRPTSTHLHQEYAHQQDRLPAWPSRISGEHHLLPSD